MIQGNVGVYIDDDGNGGGYTTSVTRMDLTGDSDTKKVLSIVQYEIGGSNCRHVVMLAENAIAAAKAILRHYGEDEA